MSGNQALTLEFENVTVRFDDQAALSDVSFTMVTGETRIILGAAGSGKSVLLKTACGLLKPDSGRVRVFGEDITYMDEESLFAIRSRIGVVFQEGGLFDSLNIEENVSYPLLYQNRDHDGHNKPDPAETRGRVEEALRFVELEHTLEKFPSELSGGMRRRVSIARATVTEPPLLLYDSPTAGLDPITANTIIALVAKERDLKNISSAIVTHRIQDGHLLANFRYNPESGALERADGGESGLRTRFMVLQEGRVVFEGSEREMEQSQDPYVAKFVRR